MRIFPFYALLLVPGLADGPGPKYTAAGLVNAADFQPGSLAPNTIASLFGTGLAYNTGSITTGDLRGGQLPNVLPNTGVRVIVGNLAAGIYYVSPTQINFLVPGNLLPGAVTVQVLLDGLAGPPVEVTLQPHAPAFFVSAIQTVAATHADGSPITPSSPVRPGGWAILYATGLGQTVPPLGYLEIATSAAFLAGFNQLQVLLDGVSVDAACIQYAGVAPGFAGLYQINLRMPQRFSPNPEIRISFAGQASPRGVLLPAAP